MASHRVWVVAVAIILCPLAPAARCRLVRLEPGQDYRIELGRGSVWYGLETVKILSDGSVTLHRQCPTAARWETTTLRLPAASMARVLQALEQNRVLELHRHRNKRKADGTQWVLWVKQGSSEKSVYCDNCFPDEILRFAEAIDVVLAQNGLAQATWRAVPGSQEHDHERKLWESIKRSP
jgi:hypothetical protein